jgi:hypothetical protein
MCPVGAPGPQFDELRPFADPLRTHPLIAVRDGSGQRAVANSRVHPSLKIRKPAGSSAPRGAGIVTES